LAVGDRPIHTKRREGELPREECPGPQEEFEQNILGHLPLYDPSTRVIMEADRERNAMKWKDLVVSRRVALLQWVLPALIALWVVLYQTVLVSYLHNQLGHRVHYIVEILFYGAVGPLVTFFVLAWIRRWLVEKERAERKVREQEKRLAFIRLEEGRRVAQHLHREVLPNLAYVANKIDHLRAKLLGKIPNHVDQELEKATGTLRETIGELRDKINTLRRGLPLQSLREESDFIAEVRRRADSFGKLHQVEVEVSVKGEARPLPYKLESSLWRIIGEALNNIALHAQATRVHLQLDVSDLERVVLCISDDGRGFDPRAWRSDPKGLGLIHMHEEADQGGGSLTVESAPGKGTKITAAFPLLRAKERV